MKTKNILFECITQFEGKKMTKETEKLNYRPITFQKRSRQNVEV